MTLFVLKLLSKIPGRILYFVSDCVAKLLAKHNMFGFQSVAKANLSAAFPRCGDVALNSIEYRYYISCGEFIVQFIKSFASSGSSPASVKFRNVEVLKEAYKSHRAIVCYSGHFLNYEVLTRLPEMYPGISMYCLYNASRVKEVDDYIKDNRSKYGAILISNKYQIRKLYEIYDREKDDANVFLIGSLSDRVPMGECHCWARLFNKKVPVFNGTERIGKSLDASYFYVKIDRVSRGQYEVEFAPMSMLDSESVTDCYFRFLEQDITAQPEKWLLWGSNRLEDAKLNTP